MTTLDFAQIAPSIKPSLAPTTYTNPVYDQYFADPFVLRHEGMYYAFGTGPASPKGYRFPVLQSADLVNWESKGWALVPDTGDDFWAPEVAYNDGVFYMYYSAHGVEGRDHQLRVATSTSPIGPYRDAGVLLVPDQPFSIDPHPFRDDNGDWYLFYCRDFLTIDGDQRVGTGIVVDKLVNMTTLAGEPCVVVRPHADWQLFLANRAMYDSVYDWHTVEGAAVRYHNGKYYCFYSGGAWERENYGISYVVADHPYGPYARPTSHPFVVMRTVADRVIGPGHNSFTVGPDGKQEYVVYHAWDPAMTDRLMRIDQLNWDSDRPVFDGPSYTPRSIPE
jgi:GH43 family beta-xylosidase